jgi:hypothetical protein
MPKSEHTEPMTPTEMSEAIQSGESFPPGEWMRLVKSLTKEQKDRIRAKCQWEHESWMGVLRDWPALFEAVDA